MTTKWVTLRASRKVWGETLRLYGPYRGHGQWQRHAGSGAGNHPVVDRWIDVTVYYGTRKIGTYRGWRNAAAAITADVAADGIAADAAQDGAS